MAESDGLSGSSVHTTSRRTDAKRKNINTKNQSITAAQNVLDDTDPQSFVHGSILADIKRRANLESLEHLSEFRVSERHGLCEIPVLNRFRHHLSPRDRLEKRDFRNLVFLDTDHIRGCLGCSAQQRLNRLDALEGGQDPVERTGFTTTLCMSECGHTGIETETLDEDFFHIVWLDGFQVPVEGAFGDDDDRLAFTDFSMSLQEVTHLRLPVLALGRVFGDEDEVCTGCDTGEQREPAAVSAHDFNHKRTRVGGRGGRDGIDGFTDSVQGGKRTDRQVGQGHVIVNGPDEADNVEVVVSFPLIVCNLVFGVELFHQAGPFAAELVGTGQGTVTTADGETVDAGMDKVGSRLESAFPCADCVFGVRTKNKK